MRRTCSGLTGIVAVAAGVLLSGCNAKKIEVLNTKVIFNYSGTPGATVDTSQMPPPQLIDTQDMGGIYRFAHPTLGTMVQYETDKESQRLFEDFTLDLALKGYVGSARLSAVPGWFAFYDKNHDRKIDVSEVRAMMEHARQQYAAREKE